MPLRHYVVTSRLVGGPVKVNGQPHQYWYATDDNDEGDTATRFMRCGRYVDNNGQAAAPWFFDHEGEDNDYVIMGNPAEDQVKPKGGSLQMLNMLFDELEADKKDLLMFNFGYENRQAKELGHLMHLHNKYISSSSAKLGRVLMITWPSQGFGEYSKELGKGGFFREMFGSVFKKRKQDVTSGKIKNDVQLTGEALAIFLLKLKNFMNERYRNAPADIYRPKLHFIVQSMANVILEHCSRTLTVYDMQDEVKEMFTTLMLTSPDVRNDIFQVSHDYFNATKMAKRTYVVCSEDDTILKASDIFHGIPGTRRLGLTGPINLSLLPQSIYKLSVKQSRISFDPVDYNHRYFQYNDNVVERYLHVFNGGETGREDNVQG